MVLRKTQCTYQKRPSMQAIASCKKGVSEKLLGREPFIRASDGAEQWGLPAAG